jgi:DUF1680 family protein
MNEVMADIYHQTGDERWLTVAQRFDHAVIFDLRLSTQLAKDSKTSREVVSFVKRQISRRPARVLCYAAMQKLLQTEFGGMNEVMADIYHQTGDERWLNSPVALYCRAAPIHFGTWVFACRPSSSSLLAASDAKVATNGIRRYERGDG